MKTDLCRSDRVAARRLVAVGGYTLFSKDGKRTYEYNYFNLERFKIASPDPLRPGSATIRVEFKYDGNRLGKAGQ